MLRSRTNKSEICVCLFLKRELKENKNKSCASLAHTDRSSHDNSKNRTQRKISIQKLPQSSPDSAARTTTDYEVVRRSAEAIVIIGPPLREAPFDAMPQKKTHSVFAFKRTAPKQQEDRSSTPSNRSKRPNKTEPTTTMPSKQFATPVCTLN